MLRSVLKKKKLILLRSALHRGAFEFLKQLYFSFADSAIRRKYLVFYLNLDETPINIPVTQDQVKLFQVKDWHDLPERLQFRLNDKSENIEWGNIRFFERGRELWALQIDNEIAVLGWLGFSELESDYIWMVPEGSEILHQLTVLPEFRGRRLQVLHRKMLMLERAKHNVKEFFISCHEYNSTSHRNILQMGFRQIGYSRQSRITKRLTFHPEKFIR